MDEMVNNILMMKSHGQAQLVGETTSLSLLDEIRDRAVAEMAAALSNALERTASELFDLAGKTTSHTMYCLYMDSRDQVQTQKEALLSSFKTQLFQRFNQARRLGDPGKREHVTQDATEFNLVEPEELELTLASNTVDHALRVACKDELPSLERRMGLLLQDTGLRSCRNPLGIENVVEALMDAIKSLPADNKIRLMLVTKLNTHVPGHFKHVYLDINRLLMQKGVLSNDPREVKRAQVTPIGKTEAQSKARETPQSEDMFSMLQKLMAMGRIGAASSLPQLPGGTLAEAANEGEIDSAQVMQRLTRIQHGDLGNLPGGTLDPKLLANGQINVLRAIKNTGVAGSMPQIDAMTLDIVALMFDYILDDPRLSDSMKALIGRLQIPVLKVAMLDKSFFSHKGHPARRLMDTLANAALGWDEQEGRDSPFYKTVDALVQRVLTEFEDKVEIFTTVLTQFQEYMAEEKRLADERACHSAQILQKNEQSELARTLALEAVQARLLQHDIPEFIHQFLQDTWVSHLTVLYLQDGASDKGWSQGLDTVDDLLWSLTPKANKEERQKLVALLPSLLKRLDTGIQAVGLERAERDHFFTRLVKFHSEAVKSGLPGKREVTHAKEKQPESTAPTVTYLFDSPDFRDVPTLVEEVQTDPRILREISAMPEPVQETEDIVIGDVIGQEQLAAEDVGGTGHYDMQVHHLKRGTWLEFTLEDDSTLRAKLAWVSPLRGTYLFTNRLGERAMSINAKGLARKLREGSAKIVDNVALIDRAVSSVFERLQKSS